ncbi:MAG: phosphoglycerate mutase family protein [Blastocatellia bacterium]
MSNGKVWKRLSISSLVLFLIMLGVVIVIFLRSSTTIVLLVRHGERNDTASCTPPTNNPPLNSAGQTRADTLAHVTEDTGLQAIYASELCRTQQTVQPIADDLGLTVNNVNQHAADGSANVDDLVAQIKAGNQGQKILVAGHSETVPLIIEKLGGGTVAAIGGTEFDNLYVVTIHKWWLLGTRVRVVRLKYGVPT